MSVNAAIEFGAVLRSARERRGLSLQELANNTRIASSVLHGLESGSLDRLPGGLYSRAFVRAYAQEVGLSPDETVEAFLKAAPEARDKFGLQVTSGKSVIGGRLTLRRVVVGLVSAGLILIVLWLLFSLGADSEVPSSEAVGAPDALLSGPEALPVSPVESLTQDSLLPSSISERGSIETFTISVHPNGPCWISLTIDGEHVLARVMTDGERESYEVDNQLILNVGDAGTFEFSIDEQPGRSLGGDGQVVTVEINQANHRSFVSLQ